MHVGLPRQLEKLRREREREREIGFYLLAFGEGRNRAKQLLETQVNAQSPAHDPGYSMLDGSVEKLRWNESGRQKLERKNSTQQAEHAEPYSGFLA